MKAQRIRVFRAALDGLSESLAALVRVSRWTDRDALPEPLRAAVAELQVRLSTAERLCAGKFVGTAGETLSVIELCTAMKRLDVAYRAYRERVAANPGETATAAVTLESEIAEATAATTT